MNSMTGPVKVVRIPSQDTRRDGIRAAVKYLLGRSHESRETGDLSAAIGYRKVADELAAALL